jgi:hypothetical protein
MNYSLIKDGTVVNIIIADEEFISQYAEENGYTYVNHDTTPHSVIGATTTDGITFVDPNYVEPEIVYGPHSDAKDPLYTGMDEI